MNYKTLIEIAKLKAYGASIPEIAKLVAVSESTVRRRMKTETYRLVEAEVLRELVKQEMESTSTAKKEKPAQATIPTPTKPSGLVRKRKPRRSKRQR